MSSYRLLPAAFCEVGWQTFDYTTQPSAVRYSLGPSFFANGARSMPVRFNACAALNRPGTLQRRPATVKPSGQTCPHLHPSIASGQAARLVPGEVEPWLVGR
jgi:hypothetical protein